MAKVTETPHVKRRRGKRETARDRVISIIEAACTEAKQIRDEYVKGPYMWPTQRLGMTKEEMKEERMAQ